MSTDEVDDGWEDGEEEAGAEAGAQEQAAPQSGEQPPARKKRRRRRRRRADGSEQQAQGQAEAQPSRDPQHQHQPQQSQRQRDPQQPPEQQRQQQERQQQPQPERQQQPERRQQQPQRDRDRGRNRDRQADRQGRDRQRRDPPARDRQPRESDSHDLRDDDVLEGDPYAAAARREPEPSGRVSEPHVDERHEDDEAPQPAVAWGNDDDGPAPPVVLAPDLPIDAPADDPDPLTYPLVDGASAPLDDVASVVGVRFVAAGRLSWCDAGDGDYAVGERVLVDSDRGQRLAWIATPATRRPSRDRSMRRVIRRANDHDLRGEREGDTDRTANLRIAKDAAAALKLPLKVFRVERTQGKLNVYYTSDERIDVRDFVRDLAQATGMRIELRQLGARDEAKVIGGIGSCGLTLCCTTWLPEFVPVSIKMAKDQGLVLSPTKVAGQCGRLKCCLVYEQAGYAELRKGLPKLGKRVISQRGEGRVVEVDVLRQRVRVSYGAGDTEVLPASEVRPMFPSANQPREEPEPDADDTDLPES